jgi:hypothetical protein
VPADRDTPRGRPAAGDRPDGGLQRRRVRHRRHAARPGPGGSSAGHTAAAGAPWLAGHVAYVVSFLTIGGAWLPHTALAERLTRADPILAPSHIPGARRRITPAP